MKKICTSAIFILTSSLLFAFGPGDWNPGGGGQQPGGGGNQPGIPGGGGGNQPDQPGGGEQPGGGNSFVYDTFITDSTGAGIDVMSGFWISTDRTRTSIASNSNLVQMAVGAAAGSTALTNVDLRASTALGEIPSCAFAGCENLESVIVPTSVTNVAADAFIGCPKFVSVSYGGKVDPGAGDQPEGGEGSGEMPPDQPGEGGEGGGTKEPDEPTIVAGEAVMLPAIDTTMSGTVTWSATGLPTGLKIATRDLTDKTLGSIPAGTIYGTPTKPGTYVVTVTAKSGSLKETFTEEIVVGNYVDDLIPLADRYGTYRVGTKTLLDMTAFSDCKVSGLPAGLKFATKAVTDSTMGAVSSGWIYGVPTKACTNTVTFSKTVSELVGGKQKKVTHTATATFVVAGLPPWAVGTFNGLLNDGSGSATLTVSSVGKVSGKIVTAGKTWSFSSAGFESVDPASESLSALKLVVAAKNGKLTQALDLSITADGVVGTFGESRPLTLWRNAWKDSGAAAALAPYVGVYTVQLASSETGTGYLSLTINAKGTCKVTGKLPDGTSASGTLPLFWDATAEAPFAVWQTSPSAYKGGCVGGILEWTTDKTVAAEQILWTSLSPTATSAYGEGFERSLAACGAWYDKTESLSAYYSSLAFTADTPVLDVTTRTTVLDGTKRVTTSSSIQAEAADVACWTNLTVSLNANGTAFVVDAGKATKPVQDKTTKAWSYAGANDAALTIGFTKATGIFKGTFTCWYDYVSATDLTKDPVKETVTHVGKKVNYEGIVVPGENLRGYYLWERTGTYEDATTGKSKTYKYKESQPVALEKVF